ncbi:hypothetical protein Poly21_22190 [Allorhodopirellula heiligendammensis]|uniref:Uncharacterized protein n=1 Tax=Allorhodopirellula heiligendammensis TaxID=2714739 RepID=A0A5C6CB43_9BACT|nr:hypothetical protein Poly21_22190 [Allorhodopirellula heiligendammensis]
MHGRSACGVCFNGQSTLRPPLRVKVVPKPSVVERQRTFVTLKRWFLTGEERCHATGSRRDWTCQIDLHHGTLMASVLWIEHAHRLPQLLIPPTNRLIHGTMSNATKAFFACIVPPMTVLILTSVGVSTGSMPAGALIAVITIWLVAAIWAFFYDRFRRSRRRTRRRDSSSDETVENSATD